jgi:hypothetical protein
LRAKFVSWLLVVLVSFMCARQCCKRIHNAINQKHE